MKNDYASAILFLKAVTSAEANVRMAAGRSWPVTPTTARFIKNKHSIATILLSI